jgi:hypothetical protein
MKYLTEPLKDKGKRVLQYGLDEVVSAFFTQFVSSFSIGRQLWAKEEIL